MSERMIEEGDLKRDEEKIEKGQNTKISGLSRSS
jgi:hypothetical protein